MTNEETDEPTKFTDKENEEIKRFRYGFDWLELAIEAAKASTTDRLQLSYLEGIEIYSEGYAEPGYENPESGIVVKANWNKNFDTGDKTMGKLANVLDALDIAIEWCDEWTDCCECHRALRTSPNSYSWSPSYVCSDGWLTCLECSDVEEHFLDLEGSSDSINQIEQFDPSENGYYLICDDFENGLHPGQDADPKMIAKLLRGSGFKRFIFNLDGKGQFDIDFSVWMHKDEAGGELGEGLIRAKRVLETGKTDGPSVSGAMERGLRESLQQGNDLRAAGETGMIYSKITEDGAETRVVSKEEFVKGIK